MDPHFQLLVAACQADEQGAYAELVERYGPSLIKPAYRMLGNEEDARDVTQEVFLKGYRRVNHLRSDIKFLAWLRKTTVNLCIDQLRQRKTMPAFESLAQVDTLKSPTVDPAKALMNKELHEKIELALQTLPPRQKAAVVLRLVEGESYKDIATILGCTVNAAKMNVSLGRRKLVVMLIPYVKRD